MQKAKPSEQVIQEALANLEAYARGMWRFRWHALFISWLMCIAGWLVVYSMPPVYEARARIFVDTENVIRPLLDGIAVSSNVMNEVTLVTREMLSRPNLAEVARKTDLDLRAENEEAFESLLASLQKRIEVDSTFDNVFTISYRDPDRDKSIAVVDSLVNTFVERSLGADRTESSAAQSFLQEQIKEYEQRLTTAEDKLAKFKRENVAVMPNQRGDYFARLQSAKSQLKTTRSELRLAQERRLELLRQIEGEEPVFGIMSTPDTDANDGFAGSKIRELESQLEELRLQYTDKHPRIGQILETIEMLKEQQRREQMSSDGLSVGGGDPGVNPLDINPVYQNMRIQLTNTEVEIASLRAEFGQHQKQADELQRLVDTVPQVEAELGRLNRDYDVVKTKYEQLLVQLETAQIGEDVEQSIDDVQFRIIDPPFVGIRPAGPARQLFIGAVFIGALGIGGALAFLLNMLKPVFFTGREVTAATGIPVLGSVGLYMSERAATLKRRSRLRFASVFGLLAVSFVLAYLFAERLSPTLRQIAGLGI